MPESLFTFLFKYPPVVFEDGRFGLESAYPWAVATGALAAILAAAAAYLRQRSRTSRRLMIVLVLFRTLAVALLGFVLLRPVIRISAAVDGENFLAILIDDSRSMGLADDDDATRGAQALDVFTSESSVLRRRLEERFTLRYYRFSDVIERTGPAQPLAFQGSATHVAAALDHVRQDLSGIPLAGAVLVTDGADNSGAPLSDSLLQLKSRAVPIYAVGLGEEDFRRDVEIARVEGPDRVLEGSAFAVDVLVSQKGYDGRTVTLTVEEEGAIVATRDVTFPRGQGGTTARVNLEADEDGSRTYRFHIEPDERERVTENNTREILLAVEDRRHKILYFEGEPRWEVKFLRQAVAEDENVQVVLLQRSAENKYLRLGVDDALELVSGFPETREELFAYRGLILGSVEAGFFTANQLRIIEEFVSQRGGGLLFLGGRRSFAEGGYAGTPLEGVLPVVLEEPAAGAYLAEVAVAPTLVGLAHAALQLGANAEESRRRWETLPPLTTRNPIFQVKPGASVLLAGTPAGGGEAVVLASQRYGRGRSMAFAVQDSWMWQMHPSMPLDDPTHARLWSQLLRFLVGTVPGQVALEIPKNLVAPGEGVTLKAEVRDAGYLGLNGARVTATVTDPTGRERQLPLEWTVEKDGEYHATFVPETPGPYEVRVEAEHAGEAVGRDALQVVAADLPTEFFGAEMNAALLRRIAEETGGRFYTAGNVDALAEDARFTRSGKTETKSYELWDMPVVLALLLVSIGAEWLLRRSRGLA